MEEMKMSGKTEYTWKKVRGRQIIFCGDPPLRKQKEGQVEALNKQSNI